MIISISTMRVAPLAIASGGWSLLGATGGASFAAHAQRAYHAVHRRDDASSSGNARTRTTVTRLGASPTEGNDIAHVARALALLLCACVIPISAGAVPPDRRAPAPFVLALLRPQAWTLHPRSRMRRRMRDCRSPMPAPTAPRWSAGRFSSTAARVTTPVNRIQAFDLGGNPVPHFKNQKVPYFLALPATSRQYLHRSRGGVLAIPVRDLGGCEQRAPARHLSSDAGRYCAALHDDEPQRRAHRPRLWRNLYSLNYEILTVSGVIPDFTEPSMSLWMPSIPT